jgi:hypothetical protein
MPQANSTTSRPRWTSPRASETTSASVSTCVFTSSRTANSTVVRRDGELCDHSAYAAVAARTASSTSDAAASVTRACSALVAGFQTGLVRVEVPGVVSPPIRCSMVLTGPSSGSLR